MSAFRECRKVEHRGREILMPFLEERSGGRLVLTDKGHLSRALQRTVGDALFNDPEDGRLWSVEIKTEEKHTGNLFLETWSNRNLDRRESFSSRGSNRGWMDHLRADLLFYYFLDECDLYVIGMFALKRWAFGYTDSKGTLHHPNLYKYREVPQGKHVQLNDTHARLVPVTDLKAALGAQMKHLKVYPSGEVEVVGDVQFHDAQPALQWGA